MQTRNTMQVDTGLHERRQGTAGSLDPIKQTNKSHCMLGLYIGIYRPVSLSSVSLREDYKYKIIICKCEEHALM